MGSEYDIINDHTLCLINEYVRRGEYPGDFLLSCLENKFVAAVTQADDLNRIAIVAIAKYIYNRIPSAAWGSREKVDRWLDKGGSRGDGTDDSALDLIERGKDAF